MKHNMHGTNNMEQHAFKTEYASILNICFDLKQNIEMIIQLLLFQLTKSVCIKKYTNKSSENAEIWN